MGAITPLPYYLVRTLEIFIVGSLWGNGIGFLPNDHLVPINGTCEDCRSQDYGVIIWMTAQILMICIVPLILVASPKNSNWKTTRPCFQSSEDPQGLGNIELPTLSQGVSRPATTISTGTLANADLEGKSMDIGKSPLTSYGVSSPSQMSPQARAPIGSGLASPYGMTSPQRFSGRFGGMSVASLAAQRFANLGNRTSVGQPSPRPRVSGIF